MPTFQLTLAYDGTNYAGWQVQPDAATVQGALEAAIAAVTGQTVRVLASGRTDAGVHALGQVVGVRLPTELSAEVLTRALNATLPEDIAVLDTAIVADGFHAIGDAHRKRYRYVIHDGPVREVFHRNYCWDYRHGRLDAEAMHRAAQALAGRHDFASFQSSGAPRESTVRTIDEIEVRRETEQGGAGRKRAGQGRGAHADWIVLEVEADGFLYNMVRAIVGTLVEVGRGRKPESWPAEVVRAVDRNAAGPTAPPQGLFLVRVEY